MLQKVLNRGGPFWSICAFNCRLLVGEKQCLHSLISLGMHVSLTVLSHRWMFPRSSVLLCGEDASLYQHYAVVHQVAWS